MSVIVPQTPRDLVGIFEIHSVAILGVAAVSSDGAWQIQSCSECKKNGGEPYVCCPS